VHTVGELVTRSEADLLDIRNFGAKSIDEVKMKLAAMGLALKDSPPGFIPTSVESYDEGYETDAYHGTTEFGAEYGQVQYDDGSYQETEQL
jgi:DNA-directed RNA polymerase subunit alpha